VITSHNSVGIGIPDSVAFFSVYQLLFYQVYPSDKTASAFFHIDVSYCICVGLHSVEVIHSPTYYSYIRPSITHFKGRNHEV
jgi:hypothetical protein